MSGAFNSILKVNTHVPVNLNVTTVPLGAVILFGVNWRAGVVAVPPTSTIYIFFSCLALKNGASVNIPSGQKPWRPKLGWIVQQPTTSFI